MRKEVDNSQSVDSWPPSGLSLDPSARERWITSWKCSSF